MSKASSLMAMQLLFYMLSFGASWGPIPWAMPSEM